MSYDYNMEVLRDVHDAIQDYDLTEWKGDREGFEELLNDELWTNDNVTGNGSGSYTFISYRAQEYVIDNMELLFEALREFGCDYEEIGRHFCNEEWEHFDVTIRCYLLSGAISNALDYYEDEGEFDEEREEEEA